MGKEKKTVFFCQNCGYESPKWMGQCPGCREWNTFVEEVVRTRSVSGKPLAAAKSASGQTARPVALKDVGDEEQARTGSGFAELDRVLGGGIVKGSLVLIGGDPGIGKSTLLLQVCTHLVAQGRRVLYISGEESVQQIKMRAARISGDAGALRLLCETNLDIVEETVTRDAPEIVVIDSIQTMYREEISSAPGSVSQVREATAVLMQLAKGLHITIFLVGHVTKEGVVAGPRVLEHMVDTVLYFEGDRHASYRVLRGVKNRFGSTNEIGVFEMRDVGLVQVKNPSEYMLNGRPQGAPGSVVACSIEGTRPMLVEVQALVCRTNFGIPRRTAVGTDINRLNLLLAVVEKRLGISLSSYDAYVNIAGGLRMNEPAIDLAIVFAVLSSQKDVPIDEKTMVFGEIGLSGEVRAVSMPKQRVLEAKKLGFTRCILPKVCMDSVGEVDGMKLVGVASVQDLFL